MTMPNFIVIGAGKSGTTALHHYLKQHPEIFMSQQKELRFFPFEEQPANFCGPGDMADMESAIKKIDDYRACFAPGANYPARGEASPIYLYYQGTAQRIQHHIPDTKLIAILRHPVDRAYSHFLMKKRDASELLSFSDALAAEEQRISDGWGHTWHYCCRGFYGAQLKPYFDLFKREQLRIYLYEDYLSNPASFMQDIFRFLNVDDRFLPNMSRRHNESKLPRSPAFQVFLAERRRSKDLLKPLVPVAWSRRMGDHLRQRNLRKPRLSGRLRRQLIEIYRQDILQLQGMLKRDLTHWLK